jgi:parallel beta-helix repeat protein
MKNKIQLQVFAVFFLVIIVTPLTIGIELNGLNQPIPLNDILYVGGSGPGNYTSIQEAIYDASEGDTVFVFDDSSPYEECLEINKNKISLIGEDKETTIIIGDCVEKLLIVRGSQVTITGFTIKSNESKIYPYYGIYIERSGATISGNIITNIETGMAVNSDRNVITDNEFINCGIYVTSSQYTNTILNNYVNGKPLIYRNKRYNEKITNAGQVILLSCINITIENSDISDVYYGIFLKTSRFCKIVGNRITNSNIFFKESEKNEILGNEISLINFRTMYQSRGIVFHFSNENIISGNDIFSNMGTGIDFYFSNDNIVEKNTIEKNINGIKLSESDSNTIANNNFIRNVRNVFFLDCKTNKWTGNYWGRFRIFPKLVTGAITVVPGGFHSPPKYMPWPNFDLHPAKRPYEIGV